MKFLSIEQAMKKGKGNVAVRGWVHRERGSNKLKFLVLRDSTNIIQCVISKEKVGPKEFKIADKILVETSIEIFGTIKKDKRAPTGYEIDVKKFEIVGISHKFPITKDQSHELLLDMRHLSLRNRRTNSILKIRSTVFGAIHSYFRKKGFYEYQSPIFTPNACEGGSTLFKLKYFENDLYLSQSWQLYAEAGIFSLEKIYCIAPSFRAEKSSTSRHLTEYWHAEMEEAWSDFNKLQDHAEALIKHIVSEVIKNNKKELEILKRDINKLKPTTKKKFTRMTYTKALELLKKKKHKIKWGKDLRTKEEDKLSELFSTPIIITHYPKQVKAFYMKENPNDKRTILGFDVIAPEHYGEIIGASQREENIDEIMRRLKEEGEKPEHYSWYLDLRKYGSVPHNGFGMGIERLISWICGLENIKDSIAFPRTPTRFKP